MSVNSPRPNLMAELPKGTEVASYAKYQDATAAVEALESADFPIGSVTIAGSDLHLVENVLGRLTAARVAIAGAGQGLTWGLFMGLFALIALPEAGPYVALIAISIGVLAGVLLNVFFWSISAKKKSFNSQSSLVASRYAILVSEQADKAHQILSGSRGNVPTQLRTQTQRKTVVARPTPRTYSEATRDAREGSENAGTSEQKKKVSGPPMYGVRLSDTEEAKSPSSQTKDFAPKEESQDS